MSEAGKEADASRLEEIAGSCGRNRAAIEGAEKLIEDEAEHEAFPHLCLALPRAAAARLYSQSFVGTKLLLGTDIKP